MPETYEREMTVALEAAHSAGELLRDYLARGVQARSKSTAIDLVTEADQASEKLVVSTLSHAFPEHRIVGEEGGGNGSASEFVWLVDPLDGTTNFAHGYPQFAVSIALQRAGATVAGVVYDVMRNQTYATVRGLGAHQDGQPLHVSGTPSLSHSLLVTGFPYDRQTSPNNNVDHFRDFLMRSQGVLRPGCASLDLAAVAAGRLDGYWEFKLKTWDLAAGALLVTEAGGRVTEPDGAQFDPWSGNIIASNGHIHAEMVAVLTEPGS